MEKMERKEILEGVKTWNNAVVTALKKELSDWSKLGEKEDRKFCLIRWWRRKNAAFIKERKKEIKYWIERIQTAEEEAMRGNTLSMISILEYSGLVCPFHLMNVFTNPWVERNGWSLFEKLCKVN